MAPASSMPHCSHASPPDGKLTGSTKRNSIEPVASVKPKVGGMAVLGTTTPPLKGCGLLVAAANRIALALAAALVSVMTCWVAAFIVPTPTSSGAPEAPASELPLSTHALIADSEQLQPLPTAVPHWPVPASWTAPEPLLYTHSPLFTNSGLLR